MNKKVLATNSGDRSKLNILFSQIFSTLNLGELKFGKITLVIRDGRVPKIDVESAMDEIASSMGHGRVFQKFSIDIANRTDIK